MERNVLSAQFAVKDSREIVSTYVIVSIMKMFILPYCRSSTWQLATRTQMKSKMIFHFHAFFQIWITRARRSIEKNLTRLVFVFRTPWQVFFFSLFEHCRVGNLPNLHYFDIVNYLVRTTAKYTHEDFRVYRSLDAYKYFVGGYVHGTGVWEIPGKDRFLIMSKVTHGQFLNQPPLQVWVVIQKEGIVQSCHCTCMTELSECCSHAAATMFAVETAARLASTCTNVRLRRTQVTSRKVLDSEVADVSQTNPKRMMAEESETDEVFKEVPSPTNPETSAFSQSLSESAVSCYVLSVLPDYDKMSTLRSVSRNLPPPLTSLHQPQYEQISEEDLRKVADEVFRNMKISEEQVTTIEEVTRKQSKRSAWYQQRAGRVTASNVKALMHTSILEPSRSLIHRICYPGSWELRTEEKDTRWGCQHEKSAMKLYSSIQATSHTDFRTSECGFIVWKEKPHMGASPDAIVSCKCCGFGCLEIKCSRCRNPKSLTAVEHDHPYRLCSDDLGNISLKRDSAYYFQVQAQIRITQSNYCDFVVIHEDTISVQRIKSDKDFFNAVADTVNILYRHLILPELLGKLYSRSSVTGAISNSVSSDDGNETWC
ncbi:uncharacterized protein LOC133473279 isoform X4 [Phyllopteryx taeniolatus]|uniref:uncharacterized protein LOC133473279 isoform X4 n=1 Tax=Phyllopteryx taeniolatus TaxID=161469 RepID=UPI002AD41336|nr:uncharacterized protein LOC133473279 isoform X4 [Phyllopteryx taeniolatus]